MASNLKVDTSQDSFLMVGTRVVNSGMFWGLKLESFRSMSAIVAPVNSTICTNVQSRENVETALYLGQAYCASACDPRAFVCETDVKTQDRIESRSLLCLLKLCASFHNHQCIQMSCHSEIPQIGARFVLISVTLTDDLSPWPVAWTSLLSMVITPENLMMIQLQRHCAKGVTVGRTDEQTDRRT